MTPDLGRLAAMVAELARNAGVAHARVRTSRSRDVSVQRRDGRLERVTESTTLGLDLELYVAGRYARAQTSDVRVETLAAFVAGCIEMARAHQPDPLQAFRVTPARQMYDAAKLLALDSRHATTTIDERLRLAEELEAAALDAETTHKLSGTGTFVGDVASEEACATGAGFEARFASSLFYRGVSVSLRGRDGEHVDRVSDATARFSADLPTGDCLARDALQHAEQALRAKPISDTVLPIVVAARAAPRLAWLLIDSLSGPALLARSSGVRDEIGHPIVSRQVSINDDPFLPKGLGSRLYDDDLCATRPRTIVEAGVLRAYLIDDYHASRLGTPATTGTVSNMLFALGDRDLEALIADLSDAIVVTAFGGGDGATGDEAVSVGFSGYRVRRGRRAEPIGGMKMLTHPRSLWRQLVAVGNDPILSPPCALRHSFSTA